MTKKIPTFIPVVNVIAKRDKLYRKDFVEGEHLVVGVMESLTFRDRWLVLVKNKAGVTVDRVINRDYSKAYARKIARECARNWFGEVA